jgi:hypothetical protein
VHARAFAPNDTVTSVLMNMITDNRPVDTILRFRTAYTGWFMFQATSQCLKLKGRALTRRSSQILSSNFANRDRSWSVVMNVQVDSFAITDNPAITDKFSGNPVFIFRQRDHLKIAFFHP